jgi:hypothetical protein
MTRGAPAPQEPTAVDASTGWYTRLADLATCSLWLHLTSLLLCEPLVLNRDSAMYLQVADMLLDGGLPYLDIVEINPPMVWYLSAIPVGIARLLDLNTIATYKAFVALLTAAAALAARLLVVRARPRPGVFEVACFSWACVATLYLGNLFLGQREHLFAVMALPYLVLRWLRGAGGEAGRGFAACLGAAAGLAVCMKPPYFLPLLLVPEAVWLIRHRDWRRARSPETIALGVAIALFAVHLFAFPPEVWKAFFGRYLGLIAGGYGAYDAAWPALLNRAQSWLSLHAPICAVLLVVSLEGQTRLAGLARLIAWVGVGGVLLFFLQGKGWEYHAVITRFQAILLVGVVAATLPHNLGRLARHGERWLSRPALRAAFALGAGALLLAALGSAVPRVWRADYRYDVGVTGPLAALIRRHSRPGDPVMFLHAGIPPTYPMLTQMDRRPGTRFLPLATIPFLFHGARQNPRSPLGFELDADAREEEHRFLAELRQDVEQRKPQLIFIDSRPECDQCPPGVGIERYLRARQFLPGALADYRELPREGAFTVYLRREAG